MIRELAADLQAQRLNFWQAAKKFEINSGRTITKNMLFSYLTRAGLYETESQKRALIAQFFSGLAQCYDWDFLYGEK